MKDEVEKVIAAEVEKREKYISSLRELATLFEKNPEVPIPSWSLYLTISDCTKEQLQAVTRMGYRVKKSYTNNEFSLNIRLGEYGRWSSPSVSLYFSSPREEVCERVVVGKKYIPEEVIPARTIEAHTEEIVEWKCKPLLGELKDDN